MSDVAKLAAMGITLGRGPKSPMALPINLVFDAQAADIPFDTVMEQLDSTFNDMQAIWIENANNGSPLRISVVGSDQVIPCPSNSNGMFPLIVPGAAKFIARTATPSITVKVILLNVPQPYFVYPVL